MQEGIADREIDGFVEPIGRFRMEPVKKQFLVKAQTIEADQPALKVRNDKQLKRR